MRNDACGLPLKKKTMMLRKTQNQNDADDANDAVYGIWVGVCKKDRHYRHHRHAYSEITPEVYYCSKQKQ